MNQVQLKILKYLSKHDDGNYHDVRNAFGKKVLPSNEYLETILNDSSDYFEQESIYNYRGLLFVGGNTESVSAGNFFLKSKIKQKGREYLLEHENKNQNLKFVKLGLLVALVSLLITVLIAIL